MKSNVFILVVAAIAFPVFLSAQNDAVEGIFQKYSAENNITYLDVSKNLFSLFAGEEFSDDKNDEFLKMIEGIENLRVLVYSTEYVPKSTLDQFHTDIMKRINFKEYDPLISVKDNRANVEIYGKTNLTKLKEVLMVVNGDKEAVFMQIRGDISLRQIGKVASSLKIDGIEYLNHVDDKENKTK